MKESLNNTNESIKNPKWLKWFLRKFKEKMLGSIKMSDINEVIKKNMERYPGISENQAAGREQVTIDWKTWFLNWDWKLWTINWDGKFLTYEKLDQVTKKNMERYPGISEDQAAGREEITINWKTGFLNWDGEII